jgi:hypothetical protein
MTFPVIGTTVMGWTVLKLASLPSSRRAVVLLVAPNYTHHHFAVAYITAEGDVEDCFECPTGDSAVDLFYTRSFLHGV